VYMALARFGKRPALSQLPHGLRADMRAFFGTYAKACRQADDLLFRAGDASAIDEACRSSPVGKLLPDDLYVHKCAVEELEPLLRVYEGVAGRTWGRLRGEHHQDSPAFGEDLVPGVSRLRERSAPGPVALHPALAADAGAALLRLRRQRQPADPASQGEVSAAGARAAREVRPADAARRAARPPYGDGDDRHAGRLASGWRQRA
jgi:hypothetical protein